MGLGGNERYGMDRERHTCSISALAENRLELSKTMTSVSVRFCRAILSSQSTAQGCSNATTNAIFLPSNPRVFSRKSFRETQ